mmetsp:Transcript_11568/g.42309  ORF Transcript_11568/g.42309 Transcript_11568/m.42309 type:complete len:245 (-) Transcript_11568:287-1021(-)
MRPWDPTVLFIAGCVATPAVLSPEKAREHFTDPFLLGALALTILTILVGTALRRGDLSPRDRRVATWYLLNGSIIHILMDGLVGTHGLEGLCGPRGFAEVLPLMDAQYRKLDGRFNMSFGDHRGSCVYLVSLVELFVAGPLCLAVYVAYVSHSPYRRPLEIVTAVSQLYGAVVFAGSEILNGLPNVHPDWDLEFSFDHVLYFWFAFVFCELLWVVVPLNLTLTALQECAAGMSGGAGSRKRKAN